MYALYTLIARALERIVKEVRIKQALYGQALALRMEYEHSKKGKIVDRNRSTCVFSWYFGLTKAEIWVGHCGFKGLFTIHVS